MEEGRDKLIPKHGGYRSLKSFQVAELVYDVTARFCDRYIDKRSRTHDQMVQAARSGVQNIAEGSQASATSKKTELKLTNVARASLEELRRDYEDFLRQRNLPQWDWNDPRRAELIARRPTTADAVAEWARHVKNCQNCNGQNGQNGRHGQNGPAAAPPRMPAAPPQNALPPRGPSIASIPSMSSMPSIPAGYPEIAANGALALIAVACSLLDRQIAAQAASFRQEGGFTERLYRERRRSRRDTKG